MSAVIDPKSTTHPITAEELFLMSGGEKYELIAGELREMSPAGFQHGAIIHRLNLVLGNFVEKSQLGLVLGAETGFILARRPDTVRGPDVSFVSRERIERLGIPVAFFPEAPDLAVEVLSPGNSASEMERKANDFLKAGTRLFWIVKPTTRTVAVYQSPLDVIVLSENDLLDGGNVVPGFSCRVCDLFQPFFAGNPPN